MHCSDVISHDVQDSTKQNPGTPPPLRNFALFFLEPCWLCSPSLPFVSSGSDYNWDAATLVPVCNCLLILEWRDPCFWCGQKGKLVEALGASGDRCRTRSLKLKCSVTGQVSSRCTQLFTLWRHLLDPDICHVLSVALSRSKPHCPGFHLVFVF